eukprot:6740189-Prymnesium_polylepis.1
MLARQYRAGRLASVAWSCGGIVTPGYLTRLSTRKLAVTLGGALILLGADPQEREGWCPIQAFFIADSSSKGNGRISHWPSDRKGGCDTRRRTGTFGSRSPRKGKGGATSLDSCVKEACVMQADPVGHPL